MILNYLAKLRVFDFWPEWLRLFWLKMRDLNNISRKTKLRTLKIRHLQGGMFSALVWNQTKLQDKGEPR